MKTKVEQAFESERAETKMFEAYPRLVQALRNLAGMAPSVDNAGVWIEYRRTARLLLHDLGETEGEADLRGEAVPIPEFLRKEVPLALPACLNGMSHIWFYGERGCRHCGLPFPRAQS